MSLVNAHEAEVANALDADFDRLNLTPSTALDGEVQSYEYNSLSAERRIIRLLTLHPGEKSAPLKCTLREASLDEPDLSYEALSYAWGSVVADSPVMIDKGTLKVTENLESALRHIRDRHEDWTLWIDAICINQADAAEKSGQVRQMRDIYRGACQVIAWIGEEADDSDLAIARLGDVAAAHSLEVSKQRQAFDEVTSQKHVWAAIIAVADQPYWRRGWIIQELTGARNAMVLCGYCSIPWRTMVLGIATIMTFRELLGLGMKKFFWIMGLGTFPREEAKKSSILDHLYDYRFWEFTDPLDRIYAFLGLPAVEDVSEFKIVYGVPKKDVFEAFARWHIETTGTLDILSYANMFNCTVHVHLNEGRVLSRPKWVPDWNKNGGHVLATYTDSPRKPLYRASGDSRAYIWRFEGNKISHFLPCLGFQVDRVRQVGDAMSIDDMAVTDRQSPLMRQWEHMMRSMDLDNNPYSKEPFDGSDIHWLASLETSNIGSTELEKIRSDPKMKKSFKLPKDDPRRMTLTEAYWRTLIGDKGRPDPTSKALCVVDENGRATRHFWPFWHIWENGIKRRAEDSELEPDLERLFANQASVACSSRKFMITENGYMGLAPFNAKVGQLIYILEGSQTPCMLSKTGILKFPTSGIPEHNVYHFVGDCYVHGMMDGEALDMQDTKEFFFLG